MHQLYDAISSKVPLHGVARLVIWGRQLLEQAASCASNHVISSKAGNEQGKT